jgi:hypothetical protein
LSIVDVGVPVGVVVSFRTSQVPVPPVSRYPCEVASGIGVARLCTRRSAKVEE